MNFTEFTVILLLVFYPIGISSLKQRPFYIIGHMVNSIDEIEEFLSKGSNVLETDIQFFSNGSVKEIYHGPFCDFERYCEANANLEDYLKHLRNITDPNTPGNYYEQLVMHFFDLKLKTSNNKMESGRDIARHILKYLWSGNGDRRQEMRVLISFDDVNDKDVVLGLKSEFGRQGQTSRLKDVGFDGGSGSIPDIERIFTDLKIGNVWLGDGIMNRFTVIRPDTRLKREIAIRDSSYGFIDKVYKWTVDLPHLLRDALRLGVDGMITNKPDGLLEILEESEFEKSFRLATLEDDPFQKYTAE